jgi:hypothetical protein
MVDATLNPLPPGTLPPGIDRKDATVNTDGLNPILLTFLRSLGLVHLHLFGASCVLTSAKDAKHLAGSKHYKGDAVDLRTADKDGLKEATFFMVLLCMSRDFKLAVFDESNVLGAGHVHVEIAG